MVKEMERRKVVRALKKNGCTSRPGKGDHEVWTCPCGQHRVSITTQRHVSPGLVRQAIANMTCLPKGWLQ